MPDLGVDGHPHPLGHQESGHIFLLQFALLGHGHNDGAVQGEQVLRGVVVGLEVLDGEGPRDDGHQVDGGGGVHHGHLGIPVVGFRAAAGGG